ncbi:glutamate--cysteine ligase [Microbacterium sp.]|uniref:carboxylate-amine ligase n=1 Tax=Microbacterium sp. TaxID=51671 RepID=UPI002811FC37|nr:glutamate--cysteine ligase [Microbacterium sp.]
MTIGLDAEPARDAPAADHVPGMRQIGVEEELLLVDAETFAPQPLAGSILRAGALVLPCGSRLEPEVKREQIEIVSAPVTTFAEVLGAVVEGRRSADDLAQQVGARAVALATPHASCEPHLMRSPRYERMRNRFGLTMDEQLTCGLHVHVTVASGDEGVAVLDRIRPWLPVLLALSANSPFWHGVDSGFASFRYQAWSRWPCAGAYDLFGSAQGYAAAVADALASGVPLDHGMIYFDARLSTHAPTVEIRISDVCFDPRDSACLAVMARALVETAAGEWRHGVAPSCTTTALLRLASWRASRWGLGGQLVDPVTERLVSARAAVAALFAHVREAFASDEEAHAVRAWLDAMLTRGTGSELQRRAAARGGGAAVVGEALARMAGDHLG